MTIPFFLVKQSLSKQRMGKQANIHIFNIFFFFLWAHIQQFIHTNAYKLKHWS